MLLAGVNDDPGNPAWAVAVDANAEQDFRGLIDALSQVAHTTDNGVADTTLTTLNRSLNSLLDAGGTSVIQSSLNLSQPVSDLFASQTNVSVHDLAVAIDSAVKPFGGYVDVNLSAIGSGAGITNDLELQIVVDHSADAAIDVDIDNNQFGYAGDDLSLNGHATVDIATALQADVLLTVDLDATGRNDGILKLDQLNVSSDLGDAAADATATYHFAELTTDAGTSNGSASVNVSLTDPTPATPGLTLTELNASSAASRLNEVKVANLSISLPMTTELTGFSTTGLAAPTITLTDGDLFAVDVTLAGTLNDFEPFDPFTEMSAAQFQAALESVTNVFEEVDQSSLLSAEIVLTNGQTLQQLVDVSDVFTNEVLAGLVTPGSLELAVNSDLVAWQAITDGSFGLSVDGEAIKLTGLNFSAATDLNAVAAALQDAINDFSEDADDVAVVFAAATQRTDADGNTTTVPTLTISSSGITSAAAVASPGEVVSDGNAVGTSLLDGVIVDGGDVATAATPKYSNAQEFRDLIKTLTEDAVSDVIFVPATSSSPATLKFDFTATQVLDQVSRELNLNLPTDVLTDLATDGIIDLKAEIVAAGTIHVGLTPVSGAFSLQPTTLLSSLNGGQGVRLNRDNAGNPIADGETDIHVTLKDGTTFEVNFDNATTVQHVLDAFNNASANTGGSGPNGRKASLSIADDMLRLQVDDHTTGTELLQVAAINKSLAAYSLGITGTASATDDENTAGNEMTTISGAALHGLTVGDHVHLSDVSIDPKVELESQTIDATGRIGAISILLEKEGDEPAVAGYFAQQVTFGSDAHSAADLIHNLHAAATSTVESHVDLHWGIDVDGSLRDRIAHDNSRADGTVIVSAGTELDAFSTNGPVVALMISDARELQEVAAVDLQDLSNLLDDAARIIGDLGVLKKDLPLIKKSVSELVNVEKELLKLTPKLKPHLSGPLQNVEGIIADALKLNSTEASPIQPTVKLSLDRSDVVAGSGSAVGDVALRLDIDVTFSAANLDSVRDLDADPFTPGLQVPIDFDLKELGLSLPNLIDSSGEALITVDAGATLRLSVGLQLTGDNKGKTFIYDKTKNGTRLTTNLTAQADEISFNASVGPFGASIDGGKLAITGSDPFSADFDLQHTAPATYGVHIIGGGDDGRVTIAEARQDGNTIAENGVTAFAFADLPAFFPTAANPLGSFELKADLPLLNEYFDSSTGFTTNTTDDGGITVSKGEENIYTANIPTFDINKLDLGANMLAMVGGWNGVFDVIIGAMKGEVLGVDIPLIGDALSDQARYLEQIRDNVSDNFVSGDDGNPTLNMITAVFYSALGPDGGNMLKDGNGDGVISIDDVKVTTQLGSFGALHDIKFELPLGVSTVLDQKIAFDLGLPGIGLDVDGGVQLAADFSFDLAIGINTDDGVYVDTSDDSEIELVVTATLPNLDAKGTVGVLQVDVTDDVDSPTKAEARFVIDLRDVNDGDDNENLTFSEFRNADSDEIIGATLTADIGVHLDMMASFSGSANFPRLRSDFDVDWTYTRGLGADADATTDIGAPTVAFNNVGLNLGDFVTNFVQPLAEQVKQVTDPVQPILDAIHSRVPVVSDIIGNVTWLDLAEMYGGADVEPYIDAIATVQDFIDLTNSLASLEGDTWIEAGSFTLSGDDALNGTAGSVDTESHTEPEKTVDEQLADHGAQELTSAKKEKVIKIPLLKNPANALGLFTGKDVDLVLFDLPALELDFNMARRVPFPPFPALYAEMGGGVSAKIDFNFGYDSSGLRKFVDTLNPADIANGLFISDRENLDGTGADVPEAIFKGYLYVQGGLDAGIFEAGVRGEISSTVNFNLHDYPDEFTNETDGKIRVDEIWRSLKLSPPPLHVFDVSGSVDAGLSAFWKIDLLFKTIRKNYNIASTRLLDFRLSRPAESRDLIATKSGGTLTLNPTSGNDHFVVLPGDDANDPNRVVVRTLNAAGEILETKGFAGITEIVAPGSAGDDTIRIDSRLTQPANLSGGAGNDTLTAGSGPATLDGGEGDDTLFGTAFADTLVGGAGKDKLHGHEGDDTVDGGDGDDELFGGKGNDALSGGAGDDKLYGEDGRDILRGDTGNDLLQGARGNDRLFGGGGNDELFGADGRDYLDGGTGNDEISGGLLSDVIIGGAGDDNIDGGAANDTIYGNAKGNTQIAPGLYNDTGDGNNTIVGGAGSDLISTGTGDDEIYAGAKSGAGYSPDQNLAHEIHAAGGDNVVFGDLGDDNVTTGSGHDTISTFAGNDFIIGGEGDDHINAGADDDTIYGNLVSGTQIASGWFSDAGSGNNTINGGTGRDRISTGSGNDHITTGHSSTPSDTSVNEVHVVGGDNTIFGDLGNEVIVTGAGTDVIHSAAGNDVVVAGAGNDTVDSADGDDLVIGGFGNDNITSGAGEDVVWAGLLPAELSGIDPLSTTFSGRLPQSIVAISGELSSRVLNWVRDAVAPTDWDDAEAANPTGFAVPEIMPRGMNGLSIEGTSFDGDDTVDGGAGDDVIFAGSDHDTVRGGSGSDFIDAGAGNDHVYGGVGRDVLFGGANSDFVFGNSGIDQLYGGFGRDILYAGAGEDIGDVHSLSGQRSWGGAGVDDLYAFAAVGNFASLAAIQNELTLVGDELHGGSGGDFLYGNLRSEILSGGDGNDTLLGDWLAGAAVGEAGLPGANTDKTTLGGNDLLIGGSGEDNLSGGGGDDRLFGGADSDRLEGHDGIDSLHGGAWIDLLVLDVDPSYTNNDRPDALDGHGPAAPGVTTPDDNATDILIIEGDTEATDVNGVITGNDDSIRLGQNGAGQLVVLYNDRVLEATWLDGFGKPLVEQFQVDGLTGDDTLSFITEAVTVTGNDGQPLQIRPVDVSRLEDRTDFVGVLNGGPGNDNLTGTAARDRLDGSSGSDTLFGLAGDDRLHGGSSGSANDHDVVFAGQGNDDVFGGSGSNELFAWTNNPNQGEQFGLFVNENGELVTDNGDLDGDGTLDSDGTSRPYQPENTGLNRMLGNLYEDDIYGGTGLDFIFGNGGNDRNFRADGTQFESGDGNLGGDTWVDFARNNAGVWYIGGSVRNDEITLDYVTEEGVLSGRHVVTRNTTIIDHLGVPRTTFAVSADLDFGATDSSGNLIWNPAGHTWNSETGTFNDDTVALNQLLPPEGSHQSIIIDALGGDDRVIVGETVQGTVWISAGEGNDFVQIESGNALLPDQTDAGRRNDSLATAYELKRPELPAVLSGGTIPADGQLATDARFTLKINDNAPVAVVIAKAAVDGDDGSFRNETADDLLFDINAALESAGLISQVTATIDNNRLHFVSTDRGDTAKLLLKASAADPIVSALGFTNNEEAAGTSTTSTFQYNDLTIDGVNDEDFYRFTLHEPTGDNAQASLNSATVEDGLVTSLYRSLETGAPELIAVNPDAWDRDGNSNDTAATARVLEDVQQLSGIGGLTLHAASDVDQFKFTLEQEAVHTDKVIIRHTVGDSDLQLSLTDSSGNSVVAATVKDGDTNVHEFLLEGVAAGTYTIRIFSASAARYELIPSIGLVGSRVLNLDSGAASQVALAGLDTGVYFLQVSTPNRLPTVYNLDFDLDLDGATAAPAVGLANTSFQVDRRDVITGGAGHDVLIGGLGEDWIFGGEGNDVISGGLDHQASDLLFGGGGSDTFQLLPDQLPFLHGTNETYVPTFNDQLDGGEDEDRILYLGGNYTTHPVTGAQVAIPDFVTLRFNTQLHRYEFTSLRYDVANDRFETTADGSQYAQQYHFFQAINIEETVIDVQAGDDFVRADAEFKFPGNDSEWGIKVGNLEQGATLGALTIEGGDGNDTLFGGDMDDLIDGGSGDDVIVGGLGNDLLFGGGGSDTIGGQHAGDQTPAFIADDITVTVLPSPADLPAAIHPAVYRELPIAATEELHSQRPEVTVNSDDPQLDHADSLELTEGNESIQHVADVGDFNADGFRDFIVTTSEWHYLFFGPVDLTSLHEVNARTKVDANDLASRADVRIAVSIAGHQLMNGVVNINGDVSSTGQPINDLVFTQTAINGTHIYILRGGAGFSQGQTTTAWPRTLASVYNLGTPQVHRVWIDRMYVEDVSPLDYDGDGLTDLLVTGRPFVSSNSGSPDPNSPMTGKLLDGSDIARTTAAHGVTPTTEFYLPARTASGEQIASIHPAGDLNNDGRDDIVGILAADFGTNADGRAYVHYSRSDVPSGVDLSSVYDRLITDAYIDGGLTAIGDVDDDGFEDLALSQTRIQFPQAVQFIPDALHLNTPWDAKLSPDKELTVQTWVRADDAGRQIVLRQSSPAAATIGIWLTADGNFEIESANQNRQTEKVVASPASGPIVVGDWYHVSATVNRSTGKITVYVDGEIAATKSVSTGDIYDSGIQSSVFNGVGVPNLIRQEGDFQVGNAKWAGSQRPSQISVADVRYFSRELSAAEISAGYGSAEISDPSDLILWYRMLEPAGTQAVDSSGNELHGTYRNGPLFGDVVRPPSRFDTSASGLIPGVSSGAGDSVAIIYGQPEQTLNLNAARSLGANVEVDPAALDGLQEFTIELDFQTPDAGSSVQTLLSSLNAESNNEFSIFLHPDNRVEVVDKGQSSFWNLPADATDGQWHHLTVIRRASDVTMFVGDRESLTKVTDYTAPPIGAPVANVKTVRIRLNGTNYLSLAEVVIRDANGNNVALNGTARQSSTRVGTGGNAARFAIDGNTSGEWTDNSVTHTNHDKHAWWEATLPQETEVHEIEIYNRTDCCSDRLSNFQVVAMDASGAEVWAREFAGLTHPNLKVLDANNDIVEPISNGKTVRIQLDGGNFLSIAEVVVRDADGYNVALNGTATQSSDYTTSQPASKAIDGNADGNWKHGSIASTNNEDQAWWQVELASEVDIHQIDIFNRTDSSPERLSNFRIQVLDANGNEIWHRDVGSFNGNQFEAFSLRSNVHVAGETGVVRTFEVNASVTSGSAVHVVNGAGQRINLTAIPGTVNRFRPTSKLPDNTQPNGFWKLFVKEPGGSELPLDTWSLRLETTGETITKRWETVSTRQIPIHVWLFTFWRTERTVTAFSQAGIVDDNALKTLTTTLDVAGKVDEFGRNKLINGIDFTLGLTDFAGERGFASTITSPSGKQVNIGSRTGGFLSEFNGEDPNGTWTLSIDTGTDPNILKPLLNGWELDVFTSGTEVLLDGQSQGSQLTPSRTPSTFSADPVKPLLATGRYIRIEATKPGQILNLADVSVLDLHNRHIAVLGTASQSGTNSGNAGLAIDTGSQHATTVAVAESANGKAWWQLDLGRDFDLSDVRITPGATNGDYDLLTTVVRENGVVDFRDSLANYQISGTDNSGTIFGKDLPTQTLTVDLQYIIGTLSHIEVLTSHTGSGIGAHLVAPDGRKFEANSLPGSTSRFLPSILPNLSTLNGDWTLVLTGNRSFELDEFDLILHTTDGDGLHYRRHAFARQQPNSGVSTDEFKPLANQVKQTGPVGALLADWPVFHDTFHLDLERFGVSAEQLEDAFVLPGDEEFAPENVKETPWLTELNQSGFSSRLRLEPLNVESLSLGRDRDNINGDYQEWQDFHGQLDNVRIWDSALTPVQAKDLSDRAVTDFDRTGLKAELDFNTPAGYPDATLSVLKFDNDVATLNHEALDGLDDVTVELRMRSERVTKGLSSIFSAAGTRSSNEFLIYINHTGALVVAIQGKSHTWTLDQRLDDSQWHDLSVVRRTSGGKTIVEVFVDSRSQGTNEVAAGALKVSPTGLVLGQDQDAIGGRFDPNQAFHGELDNLRIWSEARTAEKVTAGLGGGNITDGGPETLTAYFTFDRVGNNRIHAEDIVKTTVLQDESSYKRDGHTPSNSSQALHAIVGAPPTYVAGQALPSLPDSSNNVLSFDNDAVHLNHELLNGHDNFTIEVQIRPQAIHSERIASIISGGGGNELLVYLKGQQVVVLHQGSTSTWDLPYRIDNDQWHDVALVGEKTGSGRTLRLYIDGELIGAKNVASPRPLLIEKNGLVLGQDQDQTGGAFDANQAFYGQMDNLKIWSVARTTEQLTASDETEAIDDRERYLEGHFKFNGPLVAGQSRSNLADAGSRHISNETLDFATGTVFFDSSVHQRDGISYASHLAVSHHRANSLTDPRSATAAALTSLQTQIVSLPSGASLAATPVVADIDGNGLNDLVVESITADGRLSVFVAADFGRSRTDTSFTTLVTPDSTANARLAATSAVDVNGDGIDDLLFTTEDSSGRKSELPIIWGAYQQAILPKNFDVAANRSVTGSGDFVVDKGKAETFSFEFSDDEVTDGRGEKWVRFTTLGDGDHGGNSWLDLSAFVRADLVRDDGSVLATNFWTLDLSDLAAGTYFLKVTSFAVEQNPTFSLTMRVPLAGRSWAATDFDQIFGGEGSDWISGGQFRDVIFGNDNDDATDTVIGEPIEFRDLDTFTVPARTHNGQTVPAYDIPLEDLTLPAASETNNLAPNAGQRIHLLDPQRETRMILGQVFADVNQDGVRDANEQAINQMVVVLRSESGEYLGQTTTTNIDLNGDGVIDPATESGWYAFTGVHGVEYQIEKASQPGWVLTTDSKHSVVTGDEGYPAAFGVFELPPATITGVLYNDTDNSGTQDVGEGLLAGWTVSLIDVKGNRVATTTTDSSGSYTFTGVVHGQYRIEREHRDGWGPDSGELGELRTLFTETLGLFLSDVDFTTWTPDQAISSHKGLWYVFTEDRQLLQGTTSHNAHLGTLVRDLSDILDSPLTMAQELQRIQHVFAARAIPVNAVSGETAHTQLRAHEIGPGSIVGNVYHDFDSNSFHDNGETGVEGLTVKLFDDDDKLVGTATTDAVGNYEFSDIHVGIYFAVVDSPGWDSTYGVDEIADRAHELDQQLGLRYTGKLFENWGGLQEKWLHSEDGKWYFIRTSGTVYEWNGSPNTDLSGTRIASLSPLYHEYPELLFEAQQPKSASVIVQSGETTEAPGIGVHQKDTASITGTIFMDNNGDGIRASDEYSINGVVIKVTSKTSDSYGVTWTQTVDVNEDGTTDLLTENGVYSFENLEPGIYEARITDVESVKGDGNDSANFRITAPGNLPTEYFIAQELNERLQLKPTDFQSRNAGRRGEIWLQGQSDDEVEYYFILATGELTRWDKNHYGPLRGETVANLSPDYYHDLSLLHEAGRPGTVTFRIDDSDSKTGPSFGIQKLDERDLDQLLSYWTVMDGE